MIDESRDDFIDNDGDWSMVDDVGLNGDESGGLDAGVGDQKPSSGSGTGFPGEPNIDKTDVSESDQMGLTGVGYETAGTIPVSNDASLFNLYMYSIGSFELKALVTSFNLKLIFLPILFSLTSRAYQSK